MFRENREPNFEQINDTQDRHLETETFVNNLIYSVKSAKFPRIGTSLHFELYVIIKSVSFDYVQCTDDFPSSLSLPHNRRQYDTSHPFICSVFFHFSHSSFLISTLSLFTPIVKQLEQQQQQQQLRCGTHSIHNKSIFASVFLVL